MRLLLAASLLTLAATAQELPQAVDLVQRIDQLFPWLNVVAFDVDAQGSIYLAGSAQGAVPDTINMRFGPLGGYDFVVIKVEPSGRQIYGTAVGGTQDEFVGRIRVDSEGNLYLTGSTNSADYPAIGSGTGSVILKLDARGSIRYNARLDWAGTILAMDVDPLGSVYFGGIPKPGQSPVSPGAYRTSPLGSGGFMVKFGPSGNQLEAATYIEEQVSNLKLRANGDVVFSMGKTVAALNAGLSHLVFSTLTDLNDNIVNMGVDSSSSIYVAAGAGVRKYAPDGVRLVWAHDFTPASFRQFAVTPSGTVFVFGDVPPNYPTHNDTQACASNLMGPISGVGVVPGTYGFLMAIGPDGDIRYATFMAEQIPRYLPIIASAGDDRAYSLGEAFLTLDGRTTRWQGILRFDVDHLPSAHIAAGCLVNAASLLVAPIAPGTIMTLFGEQMGPETGTSFALQDGHVPFNIAGASITVDGKPAPVLYTQAGQINFIAPWSLRTDGIRVPICVVMNAASSCLYAPTALTSPGLFTVNSQIAAINPDGTVNSPQHPAPANSYVSIYLTGMGQLDGSAVDGGVAGFDLQRVTAVVAASFTGPVCAPPVGCVDRTVDAPVLFAGAVPTLVYGVNVVIVQTPSFFNTFFGNSSVSLTLSTRATPLSGVATTSGTLYIK
jgi:uncharacterized protein (TIGR03437 family)